MKMEYDFIILRPIDDVWKSFKDIPTVASCMPGAELTKKEGKDNYIGKVKVKLGPFSVNFEGKAEVKFDDKTKSGNVNGHGIDQKGGNRTKLVLTFFLEEVNEGTKTNIDADIQLSGAIAQFGRVGLIKETANIIIGKFSKNLEELLSDTEDGNQNIVNKKNINSQITFKDLISSLINWIRSLLHK